MKKRTALILALSLCTFGIAARATASALIKNIKAEIRQDFTIMVDGKVQSFKNANGETVYPILHDGTTYLPVRAIGELMGKTVYWNESEKLIELKTEEPAKETTVTDADVIITETVPAEKSSNSKPDKDKDNKEKAPADEFIGEERAKEIALEKAGLKESDVTFQKVKLDRDDGVWEYEIEFRSGRTEYELEIRATDGKILSYEKDND